MPTQSHVLASPTFDKVSIDVSAVQQECVGGAKLDPNNDVSDKEGYSAHNPKEELQQ